MDTIIRCPISLVIHRTAVPYHVFQRLCGRIAIPVSKCSMEHGTANADDEHGNKLQSVAYLKLKENGLVHAKHGE